MNVSPLVSSIPGSATVCLPRDSGTGAPLSSNPLIVVPAASFIEVNASGDRPGTVLVQCREAAAACHSKTQNTAQHVQKGRRGSSTETGSQHLGLAADGGSKGGSLVEFGADL